jgi:ABC-2 type transport system permease protein
VERWLAQRRTREIFAVLFFLVMISFQLLGPMLSRYGPRSTPALRKLGTEVSPVQSVLPPGIAANAVAAMAGGQVGKAAAFLGLLGVFGVAFVRVLSIRLRAQYRGENLNEAPTIQSARTATHALKLGWSVPGLSAPVAAVLEKELRYLSRSGPMLLTLITPIIMLLIFGLGQGRSAPGGFLQRSPDMGFPMGAAYSLLLLTNLVYNNFGADGGGIQFFLASPVPFRRVVLGKNLAHVTVLALETTVVWIGVSVLFHPPTFAITLTTLTAMLFAVPANLAIGNLLSLHSPKRIEFGTFGRQRASQLTVLLSLGVQIVVFGLAATTMALAHYYREIWFAVAVFLLLALVSLVGYEIVLRRVDQLALGNRETLTTELCC